jgi:predicted nucleotidyltransferase
MNKERIDIRQEQIADFCQRNQIKKFAIYGSVLRDDFRPDSDIDILIDLESNHRIGLMQMARMEIELSKLIGRKVDLRTPQDLSRYFRDKVIETSEVLYERN